MTTDDSRERAIEQAAKVMLNSPANSVGLLSFTDLARALADAGLLADTAKDTEYERGYVAGVVVAQRDIDAIKDREAKLRAERDEARREFREARDFGIGIGSEADRARADRAVADLAAERKTIAYEIDQRVKAEAKVREVRAEVDAYSAARVIELEAELAALRDGVEALADWYDRANWAGWREVSAKIRALLTDGGQS